MSTSAYKNLVERCSEIALYNSTSALLGWDQETCLPKKGVAYRAEQCALMKGRSHRLFCAPEVGGWISECEDGDVGEDPARLANVRDWRWAYDRATKLPEELVETSERVRAHAMSAWASARKEDDFSKFRPHLETIIDISRQKAECFGYNETPYDALIEDYERGTSTADVAELFEELKPQLREIGLAAARRSETVSEEMLNGHYPQEAQCAFNEKVARAFGFDFEAGRIDTAVHPFCSGLAPGDTRLTTRYDEKDFCSSLYGVLHETGHGLYEQGLPAEHHGTPVGNSVSLGIHESQSRLWENHVGRQPAFWEHWFPVAKEVFGPLSSRRVDEVIAFTTRSRPSLIRVEADEATYDLHIVLRFEIERDLIAGDLAVADLPEAWNTKFEEFFGLSVPNDTEGCLQDIHWSMGALGYFPTYTIGNLGAAQLFAKAHEHLPGIDGELASGNYARLLEWLRCKIHEPGGQMLPSDLMRVATGEELSPSYHLEHLRSRYL
ncbi:MAG: carboxypeptidase M32 [Verrucomicrobiaceae bacterium]|nr:carboxypeptidase M32 [Verrucomicrobiaceae bacterium]